jgi:hypothetical protein
MDGNQQNPNHQTTNQTTQQPNAQQQPGTQPGGQPNAQQQPAPISMTQAQLSQRLERERKKTQEQTLGSLTERLNAFGIGSFDDLELNLQANAEAKAEEERQRIAALEQQGKTQELLELERKKFAELERKYSDETRQYKTQLDQQQEQVRQQRIRVTLINAATQANSLAPEQVAQLVAPSIRFDDEGKQYVVGPNGEPRTNGQGQAMTPNELVAEFIEQYPHFARPAPGQGANGSSHPAGQQGQVGNGLDPAKLNDVEYLIANQEAAIAAAKNGQLKQ